MRLTPLLIGLTVLALASARDVSACECASGGPPCQNAFQVDAVFAGTVRSMVPLPEDGPPLRPGEMRIPQTVRVEFYTVVPFRGLQGSNVTVLTAGSGPASRILAIRPESWRHFGDGGNGLHRLFAEAGALQPSSCRWSEFMVLAHEFAQLCFRFERRRSVHAVSRLSSVLRTFHQDGL